MNFEKADRWCERGILGLVLAILICGPLWFGAVDPPEFLALQALTIGCVLLWAARLWLNGRAQLVWPPICWAVAAFACYAVARYRSADIEYVARQEMIRVLVYALLFFVIVNNLQSKESAQIISFTLVFLAMGISFYALWQFVTHSNRIWNVLSSYPHRGSGTFICPNHLAGFLEMILPLGLAYTLTGRSGALTKILLGYASLVIVGGLAVTLSRGGWISAVLALAVLFGVLIFYRAYRLPSAVLLAAMLAAGLYFFPKSAFVTSRAQQVVPQGNVEADDRFAVWESAFRMWEQNVWWGVGPGLFDYRYRSYRPATVQVRPEYAHNDYLNTLADWGLAGAAIVASALALLAWGVAKTWAQVGGGPADLGGKTGSNKFAFVLGASVGLIALLCHSMVDFNMHIPANAIVAVTLMSLLTNHFLALSSRWRAKGGLGTRITVTILLAAGIFYLGQYGWTRTIETARLSRASRAPLFSLEQIECLEQAYAADPKNGQTAYSIGEAYRIQSQQGDNGYEELAKQAMDWFARSIKLNPWNDSSWLGYGWCLDWVGRYAESEPCFQKAAELDPNGYYTAAYLGLHYVELQDYAAAKPCFERSLRLQWKDNLIASSYLELTKSKLLEGATNSSTMPASFKPNAPIDPSPGLAPQARALPPP